MAKDGELKELEDESSKEFVKTGKCAAPLFGQERRPLEAGLKKPLSDVNAFNRDKAPVGGRRLSFPALFFLIILIFFPDRSK